MPTKNVIHRKKLSRSLKFVEGKAEGDRAENFGQMRLEETKSFCQESKCLCGKLQDKEVQCWHGQTCNKTKVQCEGSPMDQQGFIEVATPTNDAEFIRVLTVNIIKGMLALFMLLYFLGANMFSDYSKKSARPLRKSVFKTTAEYVRFLFFFLSFTLILFALLSGYGQSSSALSNSPKREQGQQMNMDTIKKMWSGSFKSDVRPTNKYYKDKLFTQEFQQNFCGDLLGLSWEFMEMLVLGKIMDAGLEEEEGKLQGDGIVNFVEWCIPHDPKNAKKQIVAAARDKIVTKLLEAGNVVVVNLSKNQKMKGHFEHRADKEKTAGGGEGNDVKEKKTKEEFLMETQGIHVFKLPKAPEDAKKASKYTFVQKLQGRNTPERRLICEKNAGAKSLGFFIQDGSVEHGGAYQIGCGQFLLEDNA